MRIFTFKGGIQPNSRKYLSKEKPITSISSEKEMIYPIADHALPLVVGGEYVLRGQKIAEGIDNKISVYSSVSGVVTAIESRLNIQGLHVRSIVIENDMKNHEVNYQQGYSTEYKKRIPCEYENIKYVIVDGTECEPYLTSDYRMMFEQTHEIISGLKELLKLYPNAKGIVCISNDKIDCVQKMMEMIKDDSQIEVRVVKLKYPQGHPQKIIQTMFGKKESFDTCIIESISSILGFYKEKVYGIPMMEHVITISGEGVCEPGNYLVPHGISLRNAVECAGGLDDNIDRLIIGGPLTGTTVITTDVPITSEVKSIIGLKKGGTEHIEPSSCIKCGRCVEVCPQGLIPAKLASFAENSEDKLFLRWNGIDCIECGCCTYKCPSKISIHQSIGAMKRNIGGNE